MNCTIPCCIGIPIVSESYVRHSHEARGWLDCIGDYDVGREEEQQGEVEMMYVPPLELRRMIKCKGGVFRDWRVVVLLGQPQKDIYRKMLELGGAEMDIASSSGSTDNQETEWGHSNYI